MPSVDELFARIRAGTESAAPAAREAREARESGAPDAPEAPDALDASAPTTIVPAVAPEPTAPSAEDGDAEAEAEAEAEADPLVARRDELLAPVAARLGRSIKRALGDDQNRLLDQLRSKPDLDADELLGPEDVHVAVFAKAARKQLGEAFAAGTVFAGTEAGAVPGGEAVEQTATGLARAIVAMLRRQVNEGAGDTADRVGAAFREWRGGRVERLTGDSATQAFSAGITAALPGVAVRWVVTAADGCSDCEDNVLAGAIGAGEHVPHRARPSAGARGLPVPGRTGQGLTC